MELDVCHIDKEIEQKIKAIAYKHKEIAELDMELKELKDKKYEAETGRKRIVIDGLRYVQFNGETLPVYHPKYGGTLTFMKDLRDGYQFHVANGYWTGEIVNIDGENKLHVIETDEIHEIKDTDYLWLN